MRHFSTWPSSLMLEKRRIPRSCKRNVKNCPLRSPASSDWRTEILKASSSRSPKAVTYHHPTPPTRTLAAITPAIDQPICFPIVMDTPTIYRQESLGALGGAKAPLPCGRGSLIKEARESQAVRHVVTASPGPCIFRRSGAEKEAPGG